MVEGWRAAVAARFLLFDLLAWFAAVLLMVAAMMLPLAMPAADHVVRRSFSYRRHRSTFLFLAGFIFLWLAANAALAALGLVLGAGMSADGLRGLTAVSWGLAAAWQLTPARARAHDRCANARALAAHGVAADYDCLRFGLAHGSRCALLCLPLMLPFAIMDHGTMPMAAVFAIQLADRARPRPQAGLAALALVLLGLISLT
jgi:predicted metal-binding membrane protein